MRDKINKILNMVEKPARYIGMEVNSIYKDYSKVDVSFAFAFADIYEIGMSYNGLDLLYTLINSRDNFACERVFAPWTDMEALMREHGQKLYTLETKKLVKDFDFVGFTLQYEMSYTNIINMLDLSGIKLRAEDRTDGDPIVIGGGPCSYNPEPLADFFDIFSIGEGEEALLELLDLYAENKNKGGSREDFLRSAAKLQGFYVPKYYEIAYNEDGTIKERIKLIEEVADKIDKRIISDFNSCFKTTKPLIANIEAVHDRIVSEIFRGCTQGCRFCQAGMIYRPIRERSIDNILQQIDTIVKNTGYNEITLSSLSTCDYPRLEELVEEILTKYEEENIAVTLPSLRLDSDSLNVLSMVEKVKKSGLTFAPEAGTQRLRDVINKNITMEDIERATKYAFSQGYSTIKLYFMIGLPTETMDDVLAIKDVAMRVKDIFFEQDLSKLKGNLKITASASCFVPKPFTPFQWDAQDDKDTMFEKAKTLKESIKDRKITFNYHEPRLSRLEAIFARGDRRVGRVLELAFKKGCKFDSWREHFKYEKWEEAFDEAGVDPDFYANRKREYDEILPWDFINIGVTKEFLIREREKAQKAILSPDCRDKCYACGANKLTDGDYCPCI